MCGIAGIVSFSGSIDASLIVGMTHLVKYRGPDDHGYLGYQSTHKSANFFMAAEQLQSDERQHDVLLGHRRLSIIDLSENGRCPMSWKDGIYWITYNGEVYNYVELRYELEQKGYGFSTRTDTEVILAAYDCWGVECLDHFNGMWAFAVLDTRQSVLFCARDRLGVKPFYYHFDQKRFSFGSEIKQIVALPWVNMETHPGVLFDFIAFDTYGCNSEHTFRREVMDMRGGHYMLVPLGNQSPAWRPRPIKWWDIDLRKKTFGWSDGEYARRYLELFEDAVKLRLRSDVPVGSCLSGGLDSSGIVCMVDKVLQNAGATGLQKTFTASSDVERFDETSYAKAVIKETHVDPSFVLPTPKQLLEDLTRLIWHQDEPFLSTSIFAGWCVYGLARKHGVTVTLDGQGPDEMLGGYIPFSYKSLLADALAHADFGGVMREARGLSENFGLGYRQIAMGLLHELLHGKLPEMLMPSMKRARSIFNKDFYEEGRMNSVFLRELSSLPEWKSEVGGSRFDRHLYRLTTRDSLPGILRQVDRNAMAFSIEARLPFLDYRLVEYTFSLPPEQRLSAGVAKQVYRRALSGVLPNLIRDRVSKLGFVTAEPNWIKGPMRQAFEERFENIATTGPFKREAALAGFARFVEGTKPFTTAPWKIFCTELWQQNNIPMPQR